jgi:NADH:ubiquinone oxidoreductase subunit K
LLDAATGALLAFSLATAVCFVSNNLHARVEHRSETVFQQHALLHRLPLIFDGNQADLPEFRNRLLFPAMLEAVTRVSNLNDREAFLMLRWITAFACFAGLYWFGASVAHVPVAMNTCALTLLAVFFVLSFNHPWEHPTDFPDAIVMILAMWAAVTRRFTAALVIAGIGAANRESAAFSGVIWMLLPHPRDSTLVNRTALIQGTTLIAIAAGVTLLLRSVWRLPGSRIVNSIAEYDLSGMIRQAISHPFMSWEMLLLAAFLPILIAIARYWSDSTTEVRRFVIAGLVIAVISLVVGRPNELRILTPAATVLVCSISLAAGSRQLS